MISFLIVIGTDNHQKCWCGEGSNACRRIFFNMTTHGQKHPLSSSLLTCPIPMSTDLLPGATETRKRRKMTTEESEEDEQEQLIGAHNAFCASDREMTVEVNEALVVIIAQGHKCLRGTRMGSSRPLHHSSPLHHRDGISDGVEARGLVILPCLRLS